MGNDISCKINLDARTKWETSAWIFADEQLSSKVIEHKLLSNNNVLPVKPYSSNINHLIIPIDGSVK